MDKNKLFILGLEALNKLKNIYKEIQLKHSLCLENSYESFNLHFSVGETRMKDIIRLRKEIFMNEEGYPLGDICNSFDSQAFHFIIQEKSFPIGCISIYFDIGNGIPLESFVNLREYQNYQKTEIQKLAVIPKYRKSYISLSLMVISYEFIRCLGGDIIFIFTLKEKAENIRLYKRFGFKYFCEFIIFNDKKAVCMKADLSQGDIKVGTTQDKSRLFTRAFSELYIDYADENEYKEILGNL